MYTTYNTTNHQKTLFYVIKVVRASTRVCFIYFCREFERV